MNTINLLINPNELLLPSPFYKEEYKNCLKDMLKSQSIINESIELLLTNDAYIEELNKSTLGLEGPTNILAFPSSDKSFPHSLALSIDALHREAFLYNIPVNKYCIQLLAHGLAHLLGYDHGKVMDDICNEMINSVESNFIMN